MASDLPKDPRERGIFLRALREYSESCEPPGLTPDCPYSIKTKDPGVMGCGEECMDLLGRYNAPRPREEVQHEPGIWIRRSRRPRARRTQQPHAKSYDARQVYLEDQASGPAPRWRLAAILYGLLEVVTTPPSSDHDQASERRAQIDELIRLTEGRGLNFETQVLPALRFPVRSAGFANLPRRQKNDAPRRRLDQMNSWSSWVDHVLDAADTSQTAPAHDRRYDPLLLATTRWARTADAQALLDWTPPTLPPSDEPSAVAAEKPDADGRWIVTRFTETYLERWEALSLRKEWLYLHGQHPPPCSPIEMSVREVPEPELAKEMADRLARQTDHHSHVPNLADTLVKPAVKFLGQGRRIEATALFEAAASNDPDGPEALNNLGFCLIPDNPERALRCFEKAISTGRADRMLTDANRLLVLAALGRRTSAIDLATTFLHQHEDSPPRPSISWLWDIDPVLQGTDPDLIERRDLLKYVATIVAKLDGNANLPNA
ncbi:MAG: hypothetical protein OXF41_10180 [bacterium]|nr:hypothetical protein [bacterium]